MTAASTPSWRSAAAMRTGPWPRAGVVRHIIVRVALVVEDALGGQLRDRRRHRIVAETVRAQPLAQLPGSEIALCQ